VLQGKAGLHPGAASIRRLDHDRRQAVAAHHGVTHGEGCHFTPLREQDLTAVGRDQAA
jgi:hypothetical protein